MNTRFSTLSAFVLLCVACDAPERNPTGPQHSETPGPEAAQPPLTELAALATLAEQAPPDSSEIHDTIAFMGGDLVAAGAGLVALNGVVGTVSSLTLDGTLLDELALPGGPASAVVVGDEVLVSVYQDAEVVRLGVGADGTLSVHAPLPVGAGPVGLAASPDGGTLYVAAASEGVVEERDLPSGQLRRQWALPGEPRWLAMSPDGSALFVASAYGAELHHISLSTGAATALALPEVEGPTLDGVQHVERRVLTPRITGRPAVSPDGSAMALPLLLCDTFAPMMPDEDDKNDVGSYTGPADPSPIPGSAMTNAAILVFPLSGGAPSAAPLLLGTAGPLGHSSALSGLHFAPDSRTLWAPVEGDNNVFTVDIDPLWPSGSDQTYAQLAPMANAVAAGRPVSVTFAGGDAFAYGAHAQQITQISTSALSDARDSHAEGMEALEDEFRYGVEAGFPEYVWSHSEVPTTRATLGAFYASTHTLEAGLSAGMERFLAANNGAVTTAGAGISCATCHSGGRNDGLTWQLPDGPRQTPSLAGGIGDTAPFTWADQVETITDEVLITSQQRMGGAGLSDQRAEEVTAFIKQLPAPPTPLGLDEDAIARGEALFAAAGCTGCHTGAALTNGASYDILGEAMDTPSLRRVGLSAPYFHDGSAETLRDVLEASRDGSMGSTADLSEQEMSDLEAYLRSL